MQTNRINPALIAGIVALVAGAWMTTSARAVIFVSTGPTVTSMPTGMQYAPSNPVSDAYTFDGTAHLTTSDAHLRDYIQTTDTGFNTLTRWTYDLAVTKGSGNTYTYIGLGEPDRGGPYYEPGTGIFLGLVGTGANGGLFYRVNDISAYVQLSPNFNVPLSSTSRVQISREGDSLTFGIDINYTGGPFSPDQMYSTTFTALSGLGLDLAAAQGTLYFGDQYATTLYNNILIEQIPEPNTTLLFGLGGTLLWMRRRSSRQSA